MTLRDQAIGRDLSACFCANAGGNAQNAYDRIVEKTLTTDHSFHSLTLNLPQFGTRVRK